MDAAGADGAAAASSVAQPRAFGVAPTGAFGNVSMFAGTDHECGSPASLHETSVVSPPECACAVASAIAVAIAPELGVSSGATCGGIKRVMVSTFATSGGAMTGSVESDSVVQLESEPEACASPLP